MATTTKTGGPPLEDGQIFISTDSDFDEVSVRTVRQAGIVITCREKNEHTIPDMHTSALTKRDEIRLLKALACHLGYRVERIGATPSKRRTTRRTSR